MDLFDILCSSDVKGNIEDNLDYVLNLIPEIKPCIGFEHKHPHHHLDVWEHTLLALSLSPNDYIIRLALLLHDIGKPFSYQEGAVRHFYGHNIKSMEIAKTVLKRLGISCEDSKLICYLIKYHDTKIDVDKINKDNYKFYKMLFIIQKCDALSHNPLKLQKRKEYILKMDSYFKQK